MTDSEFAPGEDARPPFAVAGVAENLPAQDALTKIITDAVADAFARGEAHGRFMAEHEAIMKASLEAAAKLDAVRASLHAGEARDQ